MLRLCDDPLVKTLRELFGANIVRIPEERIQPLSSIVKTAGNLFYQGTLAPLITGETAELAAMPVESSRMSDVSGKRSRDVNIELGFEILDGFLRGFGIPSAGIRTHLKGVSKVSFSFSKVNRSYIDVNHLGQTLKGRIIDKKNPAANEVFNSRRSKLLVIDSVITSSDFTISVEASSSQEYKLDIPAVEAFIASVKPELRVSSSSGLELTFQGDKNLGFAFSCYELDLDSKGRIKGLVNRRKLPLLGLIPLVRRARHGVSISEPITPNDRLLLTRSPVLIEWTDS